MLDDNILKSPAVAIVIPCFRSSNSIEALVSRIVEVFHEEISGFECILIDDASPDEAGTWGAIKRLQIKYPRFVRGYRLARNVGQHSALLCAISLVSNTVTTVVTMDDDLQQLPEDIPQMLRAIDEGADLVIGAYPQKQHAIWRNLAGRMVDRTLRRLFVLPREFQLTSFRAFRRFAADEAVESGGRYSYITASLLSVTRRRINVPVQHEERKQGRSGYTLLRSVELALNLYLTYSRIPLYLIFFLFMVSVGATIAILGWTLYRYTVTSQIPMGWTSQMMMIGMSCTLNLVATAVVAVFVTRAHRIALIPQARWRIAENTNDLAKI